MPVVPINGRSIVTPLWYVAIKIRVIGRKFDAVSDAITDIWLIGTHLSFAFWYIGFNLDRAADYLVDTETMIAQIKIWIDGLVEGTAFRDLLFWVSSSFRTIANDPMRFVRYRFSQISSDMYDLVYYPMSWLESRVDRILPGIRNIIIYPLSWIYDKIALIFPDSLPFLVNPLGWIRNRLLDIFWWFRALSIDPRSTVLRWINDLHPVFLLILVNPTGFIRERFLRSFPLVFDMLKNPEHWIKQRVSFLLGIPMWDILNPGSAILNLLLDIILFNKARFENKIKRIVIGVIMWFI